MRSPALASREESHRRAPTPGQILGPYYPVAPDPCADWDLTRWPGADQTAAGEIILIEGRVSDIWGTPLPDVLVEIWQCDAQGIYPHPDAPEHHRVDPAFEGYARWVTMAEGAYRFRALRPVRYPGRAPHVHFKISAPGHAPLITQLYLAGAPENDEDFALAEAGGRRTDLIAKLIPTDDQGREPEMRFDIVLGDGPCQALQTAPTRRD